MVDIRPFRALHPKPTEAWQIACPPYDVVSEEEARRLLFAYPNSFMQVIRPECKLPASQKQSPKQLHLRSFENLMQFVHAGLFQQSPHEAFYIYRLSRGEHTQLGLVAGVSIAEYEVGTIKKHELTRPAKVLDRTGHMAQVQANTGPVLMCFRSQPEFEQKLFEGWLKNPAMIDFVADDLVRHTLTIVDQAKDVNEWKQAFASLSALYIADGHHRAQAAAELRKSNTTPGSKILSAYDHFLAVLFPHTQLTILGYHRLVRDLNGLDVGQWLTRLKEVCEVIPQENEPLLHLTKRHQIGMLLDGTWYRLRLLESCLAESWAKEALDAELLQRLVLRPILGIEDPRIDSRIDFIGGWDAHERMFERCQKDMRVGFMLHPVSIEQLMQVADQNQVLPPKSTWFDPKLRSGMVVRPFTRYPLKR